MPGRRTDGFTLLEVLVALVIAGLALVVLFRVGGESLMAVDTAARVEEAVQRAQSHLAAAERDIARLQGISEGDDGGGYRWRLRVAPVASWASRAPGSTSGLTPILFDIEVAISWPGPRQERSVVLKTRRIAITTVDR